MYNIYSSTRECTPRYDAKALGQGYVEDGVEKKITSSAQRPEDFVEVIAANRPWHFLQGLEALKGTALSM